MNLPLWIAAAGLLVAGVAAAALMRSAWRRRGAAGPGPWMLGWAVLLAALGVAGLVLGPARGAFAGSALISLAALALVASGLERRSPARAPARDPALEPSERPARVWRGVLRVLLAGPIGGIAAIGTGLAVVVWAPGAAQTRIVLGGLLAPILWAGGMAWTLSDDKILRATAVLTGVAVATFAASALRGFQ